MPSLVDLVESHLLRNLTDPDTYDGGVELADRGAVEFDERGPLHARARVGDGQTFVADLKSGPGKLIWSCSEPGGSRGALCRHCVALAVETWRRALAVQPASSEQEATPRAAGCLAARGVASCSEEAGWTASARRQVSTASATQWRQSAPREPPGSEHDQMSFPGPDFRSATKVWPSPTRARAWSGPSSSNSTAPRSASSTPPS